jgi:uncharacterized protein (TIGR00661 family)
VLFRSSEAWCHRAAALLRLPRISFDHVGIIAWCKPHFPAELWLTGMRDAAGYRALMGQPDRTLISSFYKAEPRQPGTRIVGPMLRDEVLRASAGGRPKAKAPPNDYLLAYFNKGEHQYQSHVERALRLLDQPVVVYGTSRRGRDGNIDYRAPSNEWFVNDLAQCRAVISTAGNQLIGEAIHFGKPILALPEQAFEQRLNAHMIERMGVGMRGDMARLTPSDIDRFLGNESWYRSHMDEHARDGRQDAIETLHRFIGELVRQPGKAKARRKVPRLRGQVSHANP